MTNIEILIKITCDQSGKQISVEKKAFDSLRLASILEQLLDCGWSVSGKRNEDGAFATYSMSGDRFRQLTREWNGSRRQVRGGPSRENLWITAPGVEPNPPYTETALSIIEARRNADANAALDVSRVKALESQVAYLATQL